MPFWLTRPGAPAAQYSCSKRSHSMSEAPRPPYSSGQATTDHRASAMSRSHSRCAAKPASVSSEGSGSTGTWARSHSRASARKLSSAGESARSTARTVPDAPSGLAGGECHPPLMNVGRDEADPDRRAELERPAGAFGADGGVAQLHLALLTMLRARVRAAVHLDDGRVELLPDVRREHRGLRDVDGRALEPV